ncbi:purine nucleosidase [Sulfobacillus thermosulfidooxidans DSM 9293]|uniref:Purine nucleosidase n=1 Tax=Sulfobacillus thermosulfidooxidans (strain DSM 9293 / VKM B-1269 / AT-1) TaxID=929705 RepID=A0A1W1WLU8_SULTA|nr:nucleoside hydrolase [Sulfobacillus thermosulfidooxidans]SMC07000.1 purine nucleosidase [Sulfobacillus thermosulfidooxidans DSM 9293]
MAEQLPVILDVDTGIDDALAILYALSSETLNVLGITTCFGNGDITNTTRNTLTVVEMASHSVPVYQGASHPLVSPWESTAEAFHGPNGLGGTQLFHPQMRPESESAVEFLRRSIDQYAHDLVLITTARLTNVAALLLAFPEVSVSIRRIVIMGGAAFAPGNVTAVAEANIWGDPEAAWVVFHSGIPITMVGLDVTTQVPISDCMLKSLEPTTPYYALLQQAVDFYLGAYNPGAPKGDRMAPLHDPLAVAVAEDPTLCRTHPYPVDIELRGQLTRGMTVVDWRTRSTTRPNIDVAVEVDRARFLTTFAKRLHFDRVC